MKVYQADQIKNISLLGSSGSGKTTLAEAMLFEGGVINRRGNVENKNTISDYHRVEHEYGYSVFRLCCLPYGRRKSLISSMLRGLMISSVEP